MGARPRARTPGCRVPPTRSIAAVAAAQRPDGYLNSFVQVVAGGRAYEDLQWGHELYCIGAPDPGSDRVAPRPWRRSPARHRGRATWTPSSASLVPVGRDGTDGHPEIEMALVELFRTTGERRHLDLAARLIDLRGHGLLGPGRFGAAYWQDHPPVRDATTVAGSCRPPALPRLRRRRSTRRNAATPTLLEAAQRRWRDMVATRRYLTGGVGAATTTSRSATRTSSPTIAHTPRPCSAIAGTMSPGACSSRPVTRGYADAIERDDVQRCPFRPVARRHALLST